MYRYVRKRSPFLHAFILCVVAGIVLLLFAAIVSTAAGPDSVLAKAVGLIATILLFIVMLSFFGMLLTELELEFEPEERRASKRYYLAGRLVHYHAHEADRVSIRKYKYTSPDHAGGPTKTIEVVCHVPSGEDEILLLTRSESVFFGIATFPDSPKCYSMSGLPPEV